MKLIPIGEDVQEVLDREPRNLSSFDSVRE